MQETIGYRENTMRKTPKFPIAVLTITLLLFITSLVLAFVGAFRSGAQDPLFKTGAAGFLIVPSFGWLMVVIYNRVHRGETDLSAQAARRDAKTEEEPELSDAAEEFSEEEPEQTKQEDK